MVMTEWDALLNRFPAMELDAFIVMPITFMVLLSYRMNGPQGRVLCGHPSASPGRRNRHPFP